MPGSSKAGNPESALTSVGEGGGPPSALGDPGRQEGLWAAARFWNCAGEGGAGRGRAGLSWGSLPGGLLADWSPG